MGLRHGKNSSEWTSALNEVYERNQYTAAYVYGRLPVAVFQGDYGQSSPGPQKPVSIQRS